MLIFQMLIFDSNNDNTKRNLNLTSMSSSMLMHFLFATECFVTNITLKRFFTCKIMEQNYINHCLLYALLVKHRCTIQPMTEDHPNDGFQRSSLCMKL